MFGNLDYNHSSWIDIVIQHVAGLTPQGTDEILIDPVDMGWDSFSVINVRYRNHDIDIEYTRDQGLVIRIDGVVRAKAPRLQRLTLADDSSQVKQSNHLTDKRVAVVKTPDP